MRNGYDINFILARFGLYFVNCRFLDISGIKSECFYYVSYFIWIEKILFFWIYCLEIFICLLCEVFNFEIIFLEMNLGLSYL